MPDCHEAADRGGTLLARRGWSLAVSATLSGRAVVNIRMIISLACPTIHSSLKLRAFLTSNFFSAAVKDLVQPSNSAVVDMRSPGSSICPSSSAPAQPTEA